MNQALWLASRATGLVSLLLLSATIVFGAATSGRFASNRWPRFAVVAVHRNLSLLVVVFLGVHVAGAVIDPYASIHWIDVLVPFTSSYEPFWLGLGAVALDLLIAVVVSSLLRPRIPLRTWKLIHWAGYGMFPIAVIHGLGVGGADVRQGWVLGCVGFCVLAVVMAGWWRLGASHPDSQARQAALPNGR
jgi:predicted ferric reductase